MIATALGLALAKPAAAIDLSGTLWGEIAAEVGVDPVLAYAVGLVESSRPAGAGIAPWPWTVRSDTGSVFAHTREEAEAALEHALQRGRNVDVGLMQINIRANGHRVALPSELLEPSKQLRVGMTILKEAIASAPGDMELGVGRYHSWTTSRARVYGRAVLSTHRQLSRYILGDS